MYYLVYKTTNLINSKCYIGVHKTTDLNDGYVGSGIALNRAINKYGLENFETEHLKICESAKDMFDMESLLVDEDFINRADTYNIKLGGIGGFDHINDGSERQRENCRLGQKNSLIHRTPETYQLAVTKKRKLYGKAVFQTFAGKTHSDEAKAKIGAANSIRQQGESNSQYGTMWITNDTNNKKIKKTDVIPKGWRRGRKI